MMKKLFVLALSISMLSALVFGEALAGSVSISGVLGPDDAPQANLGWGTPCTLYNQASFGFPIVFYYELAAFKVTVDGSYNIGWDQPYFYSNGWAWTDEALYDGPFTPGDPLSNCMGGWNGTQSFPLVKDHVYYLLIFTFGDTSAFTNGFGQYNVTISGPGNIILLPSPDNRINWDSGLAGPVALYCDGDTLNVWLVDLGSGEGIFQFSWDTWSDTAPATNTLVTSMGAVELWHLSTGEYQVNVPYSPEYGVWKGYAFIFNGCPYNSDGYTNNFDPGQQ